MHKECSASVSCEMYKIIWWRMKFKPKKSTSLWLRKGKMNQNINFKVGGQRIPTVSEERMKSLEHWFDESLKDINQVKETSRTLQEGPHKIDHFPLQGKFKQTIKHQTIPSQNLLGASGDSEVSTDLPGWYNNYPKTISSKGLRPDIDLLSRANLKIIMVELSIPYERRMDQSDENKTSKYEDL